MNKVLLVFTMFLLLSCLSNRDGRFIKVLYFDNKDIKAIRIAKKDTLTDKFIRFLRTGMLQDIHIKDTSGYNKCYYTFQKDGMLNSFKRVNSFYNDEEIYNYSENHCLESYYYIHNDSIRYMKKYDKNGKFLEQNGSLIRYLTINKRDSVLKLVLLSPPSTLISVRIKESQNNEFDSIACKDNVCSKKLILVDPNVEFQIKTQDVQTGSIFQEKLIIKVTPR